MKKHRIILATLFVVGLVFSFVSGRLIYAEETIYGHISYVDTETTVVRQDQTENKAVVNLPIAPGDQIVTGDKGRCEVQFDNGTVIRVDNTRLKVTTVLAPSLTSRWKITTLHLMKGQIYTISQTYNKEMFQVITPNAAFDLKSRASSLISVMDNGDTFVSSDSGSFKVMFGKDVNSVKTGKISSGKGYIISADNKLSISEEKRGLEFTAWNEYLTNHFKDLHFGINKVPPKLEMYRDNMLTYWAEKWSSLYGEWVYDDIFGYVWRPYDEIFVYAARPFFFADFTKINGQLFCVPQQPWGWVPAHMGTWTWLKGGWTWIPGSWFHPGIAEYGYEQHLYTMDWYINYVYGSFDLYYMYRFQGIDAWRAEYRHVFNVYKSRPDIGSLPQGVREIINKLNHAPIEMVKERLSSMRQATPIDIEKIKVVQGSSHVNTLVKTEGMASERRPVGPNPMPLEREKIAAKNNSVKQVEFRDFNPDKQWSIRNGIDIHYASERNAITIPKLNISSQELNNRERMILSERGNVFHGMIESHNTNGSGVIYSGSSSSIFERAASMPSTVNISESHGHSSSNNNNNQNEK